MTDNTSADSELLKVLLPIIRRATPTLMAQEIIGVQSMTQRFIIGDGLSESGEVFYYWVSDISNIFSMSNSSSFTMKSQWCMDTFGPKNELGEAAPDDIKETERWWLRGTTYCFWHEADRELFILKWST